LPRPEGVPQCAFPSLKPAALAAESAAESSTWRNSRR
jgi:hypothetical protein